LKFVPNSHTGVYLSGEITNIVRNWKSEKKGINATIDGASNVNLAINILSYLD
jgi:hypothetical protein